MNDEWKIDHAVHAQLDRLAAGELAEGERRALLAWLDEDPARWRACALAFMEAQSWEQSLAARPPAAAAEGAWRANGRPEAGRMTAVAPQPAMAKPRATFNRSRVLSLLAVAASLAMAFTLGALSGRSWPLDGPLQAPVAEMVQQTGPQSAGHDAAASPADGPLLASVRVRTNLDPRVPMLLQVPVTPTGEPLEPAPTMSDYVRSQWERRGFAVIEELRYLPAQLPDGREIAVPINQVRFEYRGKQVL